MEKKIEVRKRQERYFTKENFLGLERFSFNCVKIKDGTIIFLTYGEEGNLER